MTRSIDKLTSASFEKAPMGLFWIKTTDKDRFGDNEFSPEYECWLLVEKATDRMLVSIDAPYPDKLCYVVALEAGGSRRFISLEGAKRYALGKAISILEEERSQKSERRKVRRVERVAGRL